MNLNKQQLDSYLYTYSYSKDEQELCKMEQRAFFNVDTDSFFIKSTRAINPNRSPFMRERVDVLYSCPTFEELHKKIFEANLLIDETFKVIFVKNPDYEKVGGVRFNERKQMERTIGLLINGEVDLVTPQLLLAIMNINGKWIFGIYHKSEAIWFQHQQKPHQYSTALSTRVARAVVNIAVPYPEGMKVMDPCCGIGTVLVEALSMSVDIVGRDINRLVIPGARGNIDHFGLTGDVTLGDIRDVEGQYDVSIIDMPYNLCSVITSQEKLEMIQSARRFSRKLVIVTIEPMDTVIEAAGFQVVDRCVAKKSAFLREVIVCE